MVEHLREEEGIVSEGADNRRWQAKPNPCDSIPKAGLARSREQVEGLASDPENRWKDWPQTC